MVLREVGKCVVYVDIPPDINDFGKNFAKAMNIKISDLTDNAKYGRPLIIILDNIDRLIPENIEILDWLQKNLIEYENYKYITVFVSSGNLVPLGTSSYGYWVNVKSNYLVNKKNIKEEVKKYMNWLVDALLI
ncbi:10233_t:CDS:2 [Diversispora eburnea]|uniref:10233_t:CDS:1 n=1 Tax=Diversispora eburnea TaxID=1213867 RepID=A0A9N8V791_9GLOM|nr:10233_t:CDS:2 [Diversispora eburnea]